MKPTKNISKIKAEVKTNKEPTVNHPSKDHANRMSNQNIFKNSEQIKEYGGDWKKLYELVYKLSKVGKVRVVRHGNTIFCLMLKEPKVAEMVIINADPAKQFIRNIREFAQFMDKAGYQKVTGVTDNVQTLNAIKNAGYPMEIQQEGVNEKGKPVYRGTVSV
jgi:DUF438 domain-containing protein